MRLSTAVAIALTVLLAASTVGMVVAAPATAAEPTDSEFPASPFQSSNPALGSAVQENGSEYDPDRADPRQVIRLSVTDDGDVRWTLESRFVLTENETDQFEAYAEDVANGDREPSYDVEQYEQALEKAERSTGREMALENASWNDPRIESPQTENETDQKLGIISYSFTWTNFAVVDDDRIHFGDAFITEDGTWFSVLEEGQRLVVESPPNYGFETAPSRIVDGAVVRDGYATLGSEDFQMVFLRSGAGPGAGGSDGLLPFSSRAGAAAFGGFVLLLVAASLLLSRYQRSEWPFDDADEQREPVVDRRPATETDGSGTEAVDATADAGGVEHEFDETADVSEADPTDEEVDVDLLSDDERVCRLLRQNGGRMKQATIVKETGWSDAKVSQLLSEMDDDDDIEKLRIGRENLITLPEVDPTELD